MNKYVKNGLLFALTATFLIPTVSSSAGESTWEWLKQLAASGWGTAWGWVRGLVREVDWKKHTDKGTAFAKEHPYLTLGTVATIGALSAYKLGLLGKKKSGAMPSVGNKRVGGMHSLEVYASDKGATFVLPGTGASAKLVKDYYKNCSDEVFFETSKKDEQDNIIEKNEVTIKRLTERKMLVSQRISSVTGGNGQSKYTILFDKPLAPFENIKIEKGLPGQYYIFLPYAK